MVWLCGIFMFEFYVCNLEFTMKINRVLAIVLVAVSVLAGCGGGEQSSYWIGIIRNSTNLATGATLKTCDPHFSNQASCLDRSAADACLASYERVPSNAVYICIHVD